MICAACGHDNPDTQSTCAGCGRALDEQGGHELALVERLRSYLPPDLVSALPTSSAAMPADLEQRCLKHLARLLASVSTHLPPQLLDDLLADSSPGKAGGSFIYGTLLFADISGFTAMSERLSRSGREGAEEITSIINRYFTSMLAILRDHKGELITFGGDALLGFFAEPDSATHATQAAMHMQAAMEEFVDTSTSQGSFPLRMKVGLHRGRFFAARIGTARNMEYALFSADVNVTAAIEIAAQIGETRLDRP
jgi:class 3 adenylate cyclase